MKQNIVDAFRFYKNAADQGYPEAMKSYAVIRAAGLKDKINSNVKEAAHYFKMASDLGCSEVTLNYGRALSNGVGVDQNKEEAAHYYWKMQQN